MNNNKLKQSGLAIAVAAMMGASASAQAAVEVYSQDGTSFSVDGYFNAFYVNRDDSVNDVRNSDVKMGFLPNTIGFNFSKDMGELTLGGRSSFWTTINDSLQSPTDTSIDVRQLYATVDGSFGQVLIGKDFGLYARSNIFLDELLMGFGSPGAATGVSFGNIRTGYPYPNPSAQITYRSPDMSGLNVAVGIFEPANTTPGAESEQSAPRLEAELTYATELQGVSLTGWLNGRHQSSENATTEIDSQGIGYGVKASVAGLSLTASGFTSEGDVPVLITDAALASEEDADGYLIQGSYTLGANRFVLSYGETDSDQGDFETENTSVAVFHDVNSNFKLVAEYNMFEQDVKSSGAEAADTDTLAIGAIVMF
ncbi:MULTISPECIES: porin [Marinobacter]|jgi:predicted porin|uniref:Putative porin n=1 Tax=Marinobacter nauticus TaxID=2743 RepID=A0A368XZW2_MARNT|nr:MULTISPECIES: porin [Marinobacter]MCG8523948.1 porin [Pseudomonadales bacterium]MBN8239352.1 porin [Marinobacter nauticus]MBY6220080.1 porin [Marinobacter nauticus]MCW9009620.1 porin [Marinobacter sp.]RCW73523.1 putative porin [Marinobacter nauticus]